MSWAQEYLIKEAVSKLHLLLRQASPEARSALIRRLKLPGELMGRITKSKRGGSTVRETLSRPSTAVPRSLAEGLLEAPGYERLDPLVKQRLMEHLEKYYPKLNVTRALGAGLESGALAVAPSRFTRRVTRETGPVVLKYSVTNPWHRGALQLLKSKDAPPLWRLRSFMTPEALRWSKRPQKVYTWLEPMLEPVKGQVPERLMVNRIKRLGLEPFDIERGYFDAPQIGYRAGGKLMPIDRGVVAEGSVPVFERVLKGLGGGGKYSTVPRRFEP